MRATDPALNPFNWVNPSLGTTLNGDRLTRSMADGIEALRVSLAGAGLHLAAEVFAPAQLATGSTTQAYRMALGAVTETGCPDTPLFKVGVRTVATYVDGEASPDFRMRPLALDLDDVAMQVGEPLLSRADSQAWADEFCSKLTADITP